MHVITPSDLKKDAIERYSEMLEKPRSLGHKKFLINEIKKLQNESHISINDHLIGIDLHHCNQVDKRLQKISERD